MPLRKVDMSLTQEVRARVFVPQVFPRRNRNGKGVLAANQGLFIHTSNIGGSLIVHSMLWRLVHYIGNIEKRSKILNLIAR